MSDVIGKYGHLTIVNRLDEPGGWCIAKCDCGNLKRARLKYVRAGRIKTCGKCELGRRLMSQKREHKDNNEKDVSPLYNRYIRECVEGGLPIVLDQAAYIEKVRKNCSFCGISPLQRKKGPRMPYHTLVLIDPKKDKNLVTANDLVSCCTKCNRWKGLDNYEVFLQHVIRIFYHLKNS